MLLLCASLPFTGSIRAASIQDVLNARMAEQQEETAEAESESQLQTDNIGRDEAPAITLPALPEKDPEVKQSTTASNEIEMDLSVMSVVMSYVEITRIIANPTEYLDRKIRIAGSYYALGQSAAERENYCSMYDGCCTYCDVRFVPQDPNQDPAGYIPENQWVTVTGTFGVIVEGPHPVYGLINAKVSAVNQ